MASGRLSDAAIIAQIPEARARERLDRRLGHRTTRATYDRTHKRIVLELTNGVQFAFPARSVAALRGATAAQLAAVTVDRSGHAIRWEALDVDLSVPGLLLAAVGDEVARHHVASMLGKSRSPAKTAAARANGAKGGRPKKSTTAKGGARALPAPPRSSIQPRPSGRGASRV
jgi:hypothetical protein